MPFPGGAELGVEGEGVGGGRDEPVDAGDDPAVLSGDPVPGVVRQRRRVGSGADGLHDLHEGSRLVRRDQQVGAGGEVRDEVLQQVGAAVVGLLRAVARALEQHAVLLVPEGDPAAAAVHQHVRIVRLLGAQGRGDGDRVALRGGDADAGGVVGLDGVGAQQLGLDTGDVLGTGAAAQREGGGDGVGERVGQRPVDHVDTVQPPLARPGRPLEVVLVPHPGTGPAEPEQPADRALVDQLADGGQGVRAQRLEADLADDPGRGDPVGHPAELGVRGGGRLLQEDVHAPLGRREGEVGVGRDRGADHGDPGAGGVQQGPEVGGLLGRAEVAELLLGQRRQLADADQPYDALFLQAADVLDVPAAVPAGAGEDDGQGGAQGFAHGVDHATGHGVLPAPAPRATVRPAAAALSVRPQTSPDRPAETARCSALIPSPPPR